MNGDLIIGKTPSGKGYKVYCWGQPNDHIMDWRGCNFRVITIDGQPKRGFATVAEALAFARVRFPTEDDFDSWARRCGDGQFLSDDRYSSLKMIALTYRNGWVISE